ncbi:hypothetical protein [Methanocella sp. MCL-LM]|uniref:hypothetical protein n=1 Tax=Methanocella sp. MCL-LM TaxID=3412035 RepID=UPI003C74F503
MEAKYLKAIKAGLICAVIIILTRFASHFIFDWALSKPSVREWAAQQSLNPVYYPPGTTDIPPEVMIAGIALIAGGLIIFALYVLAGILAAWFTAKAATGMADLLIAGAIAGAVSQAVSVPFQLGFILLSNMYYGGVGSLMGDIQSWLLSALIGELIVYSIIAAILAAIAALLTGAMIKAFGKKHRVE